MVMSHAFRGKQAEIQLCKGPELLNQSSATIDAMDRADKVQAPALTHMRMQTHKHVPEH